MSFYKACPAPLPAFYRQFRLESTMQSCSSWGALHVPCMTFDIRCETSVGAHYFPRRPLLSLLVSITSVFFVADCLTYPAAITYMIISPIINGLACFSFFLFYELYKYLFLYQFDQPSSQDTGGLFFPKAIQHLFVGLYLQQICLAALFFLARDTNGNPSAIPEGALMIVLIAMTVCVILVLISDIF